MPLCWKEVREEKSIFMVCPIRANMYVCVSKSSRSGEIHEDCYVLVTPLIREALLMYIARNMDFLNKKIQIIYQIFDMADVQHTRRKKWFNIFNTNYSKHYHGNHKEPRLLTKNVQWPKLHLSLTSCISYQIFDV